MKRVVSHTAVGFKTAEFSTLFEIAAGPQGLEAAVRKLQLRQLLFGLVKKF